jgi:hypothetical protein
MNEDTRAKPSVLAKHDPLQAVQAPTPRVLTVAVKGGVHTMLQSKEHAGPAEKSSRRGFRAARATIERGPRAPQDVSEVSAAGEERVP